jgi:uncharacterized protein
MPCSYTVSVRLKPNAKQNALEFAPDGTLLARVNAPPVEGRANAALVALLAETLRVPKSFIEIRHGLASRNKAVSVAGLTKEEVLRRVAAGAAG